MCVSVHVPVCILPLHGCLGWGGSGWASKSKGISGALSKVIPLQLADITDKDMLSPFFGIVPRKDTQSNITVLSVSLAIRYVLDVPSDHVREPVLASTPTWHCLDSMWFCGSVNMRITCTCVPPSPPPPPPPQAHTHTHIHTHTHTQV